jgi:hypothetical protein
MLESAEWRVIKTFPKYEINRRGVIRIKKTGQIIFQDTKAITRSFVWLYSKGGGVHRRLVSTLRNNAFALHELYK